MNPPDNQPAPGEGGVEKWPAPIQHKDCNPQYPIPFVCKQHEWPYGSADSGGPYCIWCEVLRNEQGEKLNQQLQSQIDEARAERQASIKQGELYRQETHRWSDAYKQLEAERDRLKSEAAKSDEQIKNGARLILQAADVLGGVLELRQKLAEAEAQLKQWKDAYL